MMTKAEIEAFQAKLSNEISNIYEEEKLAAIKRIIDKKQPQKVNAYKRRLYQATIEAQQTSPVILRRYTIEDVKVQIADALKLYNQGICKSDDNSQKRGKRSKIKWSINAYDDLTVLLNYVKSALSEGDAENIRLQMNSAVEIIDYNPKTGKKDPLLADIVPGNDIRYISVNKYCKMYYTEFPEAILVLTIQNTSELIDSNRKFKR